MRIIAGQFRGRKLLPPQGRQTRPITDRVKQSLFDILSPVPEGAVVYDCFAGTGSLGLEAASRGALSIVFFERDGRALRRLKQNIDSLGIVNRCRIVRGDIFAWFQSAAAPPPEAGRADLVFLDPPYRFLEDQAARLRALVAQLARHHLAHDGRVVFRHATSDELELPALVRYDRRDFGSMTVEFLRLRDA